MAPKRSINADNVAELRRLLKDTDAQLATPDDDEAYTKSIRRWSRAAEKPAGACLIPKSAEAISITLKYATEHGLEIAVKGGGHSTAGASSTDGGLLIDLNTHMRTTDVDVSNRTIKVGGGFGWLTVKHGLVVDNLISCTVVLADGSVVKASDTENQDLFWALRGAGQNFGVGIEFEFRAHEQGDVWAGFMMFPPTPDIISKAVDILNIIFTPDEHGNTKATGKLAAALGFVKPPPAGGAVMFFVAAVFQGPESDGKELLKDILALNPLMSSMAPMPYAKANALLDLPIGARVSIKGAGFELPIRADFVLSVLDSYKEFTDKTPDAAESQIMWELLDPTKIVEKSNADMAFANRGRHFNAAVAPLWREEGNDVSCRQWSRDVALLFKAELQRGGAETGTSNDGWIGKRGGHGATMVYGNYDREYSSLLHDKPCPIRSCQGQLGSR
jgi:hypothetical protein